jgi:hypothetical protein
MILRTVPNSDISLGSLTLPVPEAGDLLELHLLHIHILLLTKLISISYNAIHSSFNVNQQ